MTRRCAVLAGFLLTSSTFPDVDPGRSYERLWKTAQEVARTHLTVTAIEDAARQVIEGSCDIDPVVVIVTPGGNSKSRCGPSRERAARSGSASSTTSALGSALDSRLNHQASEPTSPRPMSPRRPGLLLPTPPCGDCGRRGGDAAPAEQLRSLQDRRGGASRGSSPSRRAGRATWRQRARSAGLSEDHLRTSRTPPVSTGGGTRSAGAR
jgi:hypothetical protein